MPYPEGLLEPTDLTVYQPSPRPKVLHVYCTSTLINVSIMTRVYTNVQICASNDKEAQSWTR
jgi:hypothetical protein